MSLEHHSPCTQCGENRWFSHGTVDIPIMKDIPEDLLKKHQRGEIKIDFEEYRVGFIKTSGFTCKSCGYTFMKDEKGNIHQQNYDDIEK